MYLDPIYFHRQKFDKEPKDLLTALQSVEINPVELCNRKCVFCPRHDVYKNRHLYMSPETAHSIGKKLSDINYLGGIGFSGFGEPLLHHSIVEILKTIKSYLPSLDRYEIITNGDLLSVGKVHDLLSAGITTILVNLYDGKEQIHHFEELFKAAKTDRYLLRHHYLGPEEDYGLTLNNRAGSVSSREITKPLKRTCFLPFYKFVIDWDGGIILCPQDWQRKGNLELNINEHTIPEIWLSEKITKYRMALIQKDRSCSPCRECDCLGILHGDKSYNLFLEFSDA